MSEYPYTDELLIWYMIFLRYLFNEYHQQFSKSKDT